MPEEKEKLARAAYEIYRVVDDGDSDLMPFDKMNEAMRGIWISAAKTFIAADTPPPLPRPGGPR